MAIGYQTSEELTSYPLREFIMLAGKDSVGKSCGLVSTAWWIEQVKPEARFYIIDTENKFKSALKSFGADMPRNIRYSKTDTMNDVTAAVSRIMKEHRPGDWLGVESMGPIWDQAQDLAYQAIAGTTKAEYLESRPKSGKGSGPIPSPDDFWKIAKGAYDGAFLDPLRHSETLNVILTSVAKPLKDQIQGRKENQDRKALRIETGMDMNLSGSPTTPSVVETLCLLELNQGAVSCQVIRDNLSALEDSRITFPVPGRKTWALTFWEQCRAGEVRL